MLYEDITQRTIEAAMNVHSALGPGLLESTYGACLFHQFTLDGLHFEHQVRLPIVYQCVQLEAGYRIDFLVENCVIVELKAVEKLLPLHTAQMITYLKLSGRPVVVNGYPQGEAKQDLPSVSSVVESLVEGLKGSNDTSGH